jgi:hypothetical protein
MRRAGLCPTPALGVQDRSVVWRWVVLLSQEFLSVGLCPDSRSTDTGLDDFDHDQHACEDEVGAQRE